MDIKLPIETKNPLYGLKLYPEAVEYMDAQQDVNWFAKEIKVENDKQDFLVNMTLEELDLAKINTQVFVELEQDVGAIWDQISHWFPHFEIEAAATQMKCMEIAVHAPFYQKLSDVLLIDPHETARVQKDVQSINSKLTLLQEIITKASDNKLLALASLSMIEQVLLFSNFAMLRSFQVNGNNRIINTMQGLDFVIRDETLHGEFAKYLFSTMLRETLEVDPHFNSEQLYQDILNIADEILLHEDAMTDYIFSTEETIINSIDRKNLKAFTRERMNFVLNSLNLSSRYTEVENNISKWFFKGANTISITDFFARGSSDYTRNWSDVKFTRLPFMKDLNVNNK